ncbi:hypothetical protein ABVK25_000290 [Lepraria finkii]|uniref:Tubulin-specific chaperone A n=1 Tax=Lepraria finkii TaxID=1340010 RepID=A0ABR4BMQ1_9LECA
MAPPSQLSIATSSIDRLLKEESSYRLELAHQQNHLEKLQFGGPGGVEDVPGNSEFLVKQQKQAIEETKAVFGPLRERIAAAVETLGTTLKSGAPMDDKQVAAANDAMGRAKATYYSMG